MFPNGVRVFFKIFPDFIKLFVQIPSHKYKNWPDLKVDI